MKRVWCLHEALLRRNKVSLFLLASQFCKLSSYSDGAGPFILCVICWFLLCIRCFWRTFLDSNTRLCSNTSLWVLRERNHILILLVKSLGYELIIFNLLWNTDATSCIIRCLLLFSLMFWLKDKTNCFKFLLAEYWGLEHCLISADPCHFTCERSREAIQRSDYLQIHTDVVPLRSTTLMLHLHRAAATMFKHGLFQCSLSMEKMH